MDCQNVVFSKDISEQRIGKYLGVFSPKSLNKIISLALHLLGTSRESISSVIGIPEESVKTTLRRVQKDGLPALRDRRFSPQSIGPPPKSQASLLVQNGCCTIGFGSPEKNLQIPLCHTVHLRTVLLSLFQAEMLSTQEVSTVLGISKPHCRDLSDKLLNMDVVAALVDKRQGQKHDFVVGKNEKSAIIEHFAARAITGHSTSSRILTEVIMEEKKISISPRTIRWHIEKLGLRSIKESLPELAETLKKTSEPSI